MITNFTEFPLLTTKRLVLRPLIESDNEAIYNYMSDKANWPFVDVQEYTSVDQATKYITKMNLGVSKNKWIIWAITLSSTKEIIGTISIWNLNAEEDKAEYGYGLFKEYRGNGYMSESIHSAKEYAFNIMKLKTIEAYTNTQNELSRKLLSNLGFQYIKTIDENGTKMAVYQIKISIIN